MTSPASDLRRLNGTLRLFHEDIVTLEKAAEAHEKSDSANFAALQGDKGMAGIHRLLTHIDNRLTTIQDSIVEAERRINARLDGIERREKNGR